MSRLQCSRNNIKAAITKQTHFSTIQTVKPSIAIIICSYFSKTFASLTKPQSICYCWQYTWLENIGWPWYGDEQKMTFFDQFQKSSIWWKRTNEQTNKTDLQRADANTWIRSTTNARVWYYSFLWHTWQYTHNRTIRIWTIDRSYSNVSDKRCK